MFRYTFLAVPMASALLLLGTASSHQASAAQFSKFFSADQAQSPFVQLVRDGGGRWMGGGGGGGGGRSFGGGGGGGFSGSRSFGGGGGGGGGNRFMGGGTSSRGFSGASVGGGGSAGGPARSFGGGFSGGNRFSGGSAIIRREGGGAFTRRGDGGGNVIVRGTSDGGARRVFVYPGGDSRPRLGSSGGGDRPRPVWKGDGKKWADYDRDRHHGKRHHRRHRFFARSLFYYPGYYDWPYTVAYNDYDCEWLRQRAIYTGSRYWWWRYQVCTDWY